MPPLDGVVVLDLTRHLPGPFCTQALVDLGARVIKVEDRGAGDPVRAVPPHDASGLSAAFRALNQGKPSLALDLKKPAGAALLLDLAAKVDVLVEGFRPGVMARLGVGPEACQARNPRLVWCSLSGYGQDGPYRDRPGHDLNYETYSGLAWVNADRSGQAITPGLPFGDMFAGLAALSGILAGLVERGRTGRGKVVDACMLDALVSVQALNLAQHRGGQPLVPGALPLSGQFPCYRLYRCEDGKQLAVAGLEPKFWELFCEALERPDWVGRAYDPSLHPEVEALLLTRPRDLWRLVLEEQGCCVSPVLDYDELAQDPQVVARGLLGEGRVAPPVRFAGEPLPGPRPVADRPGADSRALLSELLGVDASSFERLVADGVVS